MQSSEELGELLGHIASISHRQVDQILQERLGIGMSQFAILSSLEKWPESKQRVLAARLGQTEASVSRQVSLLKQKGLLSSQVDPTERRQHLAVLTTRGAKLTRAAREVLEQYNHQLFERLDSKKREQLQALLTLLHEQTCAPDKRLACNWLSDIAPANH